jgi:hypothetical protein
MQDDWLFHTSRARELRERDRVERWWADKAKLPRTPGLLVEVMIELWPPRGDPGLLRENTIDTKIRAHSDVPFRRTSLTTALKFIRDGKLPRRRPARTNTNNLRTNNR